MKDLHDGFVYRKIKQPSKWIAWPVWLAFRAISKMRNTEFVYDEDYLACQGQQMLYLCQHRSREDYIYTFAGMKRTDVHFLCGYQNIFIKGLYPLLKRLGVISKMLYQPDMHATIQMMHAAKQGGSLVVFPEGIQSTSGSTHPINPATMKLLIKLKLPVALVTLKGSYFTRTRYSADVKKGKITARYSMLFTPEDFKNYTKEELYSKFLRSFQYNEFEEHKGEKISFRGKKPNIYGLDNIIYKCPHCLAEYRFAVEGDQMRCDACGFTVSMDEYYDIHPVEGQLPFENTDLWYKWQRKVLGKEVEDDSFVMSTKVRLSRMSRTRLGWSDSLESLGEGILTLTNKGLTYRGTKEGEEAELFFKPELVFSLTMSLQYDLDLYYEGQYYNFKLLENEKQVAKWMIAAEEIHNLYDRAWSDVSCEVYQ